MVEIEKQKINSTSIENVYNKMIFGGILDDKMTVAELVEEMQIRGLNPVLYTEKAFLNLLLHIIEQCEDRKTSVKEAKKILETSLKKKTLQKWGEEELIATKLFVEYRKKIPGGINVDTQQMTNENRPKRICLVCPYCGKEVEAKPKKTNDEYTCPNCDKVFLSVVGTVRGVKEVGGYAPVKVIIRIENVEGGESTITYFSSRSGLELRSGDLVSANYKKGLLGGGYGNKPSSIQNFTLGEYYREI